MSTITQYERSEKKTNESRSINLKLRHRRNWIDGRSGCRREGVAAARRTEPPPELKLRSMVQAENTATSVTALKTGVAKKINANPCPFKLDSVILIFCIVSNY